MNSHVWLKVADGLVGLLGEYAVSLVELELNVERDTVFMGTVLELTGTQAHVIKELVVIRRPHGEVSKI